MAFFLHHKLNSCHGNYSRGETIQGRKLFPEIRYARYMLYGIQKSLKALCNFSTYKEILNLAAKQGKSRKSDGVSLAHLISIFIKVNS